MYLGSRTWTLHLQKLHATRPRRSDRKRQDPFRVEFGAKGFEGASTRAIASRVQAPQPQINYHFESKTALWTAAVDYLFGLLREAIYGVIPAKLAGVEVSALAAAV